MPATAHRAGCMPTTTAIGHGFPRSWYFRMMMSPCLPFEVMIEATASVVHLHAVAAVVDPAGVRILHDHDAAGADVVAAVALVPSRRRNLEEVDVVAGGDVLQQRAAGHRHRRDASARPSCSRASSVRASISLVSVDMPSVDRCAAPR